MQCHLLETKDSNLYKLVPKSRALPIKLVSKNKKQLPTKVVIE